MAELRSLGGGCDRGATLCRVADALVRAGELECGLADASSPHAATAARVTDRLASLLVDSIDPRQALGDALAALEAPLAPETVRISVPEGFAYYALHPIDFVHLLSRLAFDRERACVIGIRSIGTTLSAVITASLRKRGAAASRITVRPHGHPFDRSIAFGEAERTWLERERAANARALVVDEGPGMSGSSFLAVAEGLLGLGFRDDRVHLLGTRNIDPECLVARDAATRWRRFRSDATAPSVRLPAESHEWIGGGAWRAHVYADRSRWPACWPMTERAKFFSPSKDTIFKFEGFGRQGAQAFARAEALARAHLGPSVVDAGDGYFAYEKVIGRPLTSKDASPEVLSDIGSYCGARSSMFARASIDGRELATMLDANWHRIDVRGARPEFLVPALEVARPVIADARMMPHEWITTGDRVVKVDAVSHGDDHFFPGPVDIAWDLAGTIVEWDLGRDAREFFLAAYERASGDRAQPRIDAYLLAYAIFRFAFTKMALESLDEPEERTRMASEHRRYRTWLDEQVPLSLG